jgi:CRISPR-associated protein Cas2
MYVILVYDIQVDRIDPVRIYLKKFLNWTQNSVFEGDLTLSEIEEIKSNLANLIDQEKDSLIIYEVRDKALINIQLIGKTKSESSNII